MRCPSCQRPIDHEADTCYSCGYAMADAIRRFGANQVRMRQVHDAADCLRVAESHDIAETIKHLEERFPQLLFTVYLGELNGRIPLGELGFWLLNQCRVEGTEMTRPNDCGILFLVDVESKEAGLALGYLPELLLSEKDCLKALAVSRGFFVNGEFGEGVIVLFRRIEKLLTKKAREMKGLSREQKRSHLMRNRVEMNNLALPRPYVPVQFKEGARSQFESEERILNPQPLESSRE